MTIEELKQFGDFRLQCGENEAAIEKQLQFALDIINAYIAYKEVNA